MHLGGDSQARLGRSRSLREFRRNKFTCSWMSSQLLKSESFRRAPRIHVTFGAFTAEFGRNRVPFFVEARAFPAKVTSRSFAVSSFHLRAVRASVIHLSCHSCNAFEESFCLFTSWLSAVDAFQVLVRLLIFHLVLFQLRVRFLLSYLG